MIYDILPYALLAVAAAVAVILAFKLKKLKSAAAERGAALVNLREAYKSLEDTKPLRELGQSVAFINHEIKNYMMVISGYTSLLQRSGALCDKDREMVNGIAEVAAKLQDLNMSVLELSKSKATHENMEFDLPEKLESCVNRYFDKRSAHISLSCAAPEKTIIVNGSPEKVERVFINAFHNSFEAGARSVRVRMFVYNYMALTVIEDDGAGSDAGDLQNFFTTFFTTKHGAGGTGLGLCVIRSIVEAHNGNVSIYSKNLLGGGRHGLLMQIVIPASKKTPCAPAKSEVMLVKGVFGEAAASNILRVLKNLKIIPHIANTAKSANFDSRSDALGLIVLAAAPQTDELKARTAGKKGIKVLTIQETECGALMAIDRDTETRELFTEELMVSCLCAN